LVGGDAWNWIVEPDVPVPSGGALKYFFRGPKAQTLDLNGTINADGTVSFAATGLQTSALVGSIAWQLCLFDADQKRTELGRGSVDVLPDIASQSANTGFDGRSWVKRSLDNVTAVLEGRAGRVEESYVIGGRQLKLMSPDELLKLQGDLQTKYEKELASVGQKVPGANQVLVRFGRSGGSGRW
jgi:hypothetical protein